MSPQGDVISGRRRTLQRLTNRTRGVPYGTPGGRGGRRQGAICSDPEVPGVAKGIGRPGRKTLEEGRPGELLTPLVG
jgi:hypothetical protein